MGVQAGVRPGTGRPLWAEITGGIVGIVSRPWDYEGSNGSSAGSATVVRSGGDLAILLGRPTWKGKLYAGPLAAIELVWLDATSNDQIQHAIRTGAAAGLRLGYQYFWKERFFVRLDATGCMAIVRQRIATVSHPDIVLFSAPPAYLAVSAGLGIWF